MCLSIHVSLCLEDFYHKPALVAPIILWLEYFLCAHHTIFPNFQLLGTCVDLHGPAFLPTWPFTACSPPCAPFLAPLCRSMPLHSSLQPSSGPSSPFTLLSSRPFSLV